LVDKVNGCGIKRYVHRLCKRSSRNIVEIHWLGFVGENERVFSSKRYLDGRSKRSICDDIEVEIGKFVVEDAKGLRVA
jgi:hypothetical protein